MPQPKITTDWLCICTSGQAVDGRPIEPQWLRDAAATYNRNTYTALLWPHHTDDMGERNFTYNLGEVDTLKTEDVEGRTKLYAQLIPNQFLIGANNLGQKLFTSAEFVPDFCGSGKDYLMGLVVTDIPASLGTEKITFNIEGESHDGQRGNIEKFSLGTLKNSKPSVWSRLFSVGKNKDFAATNNEQPDAGGDEKQMEELKTLIETLTKRIAELEAKATGDADTPQEAATEVGALADEIAEAADQVAEIAAEVADKPEDTVIAEKFSVAKTALATLIKAFTADDKPAKREKRQRRQYSARKPAGNNDAKEGDEAPELAAIKTQLDAVMQKFTAMEGNATKTPGKGPADTSKPFNFI